MILAGRRLFRSLQWYHHVMIIVTILVPLILSVVIPLLLPDCLVVQVIVYAVAPLVLLVLAELAVAIALDRDRSKAERFISQEVNVVSGLVSRLRDQHGELIERHGYSIEDLRRQIDDQDEVFRSAFEGLGVALPATKVLIRASTTLARATMSAPTVSTTGGSKWGRFLRLFQRFGRWLKETVWGIPDHP